MANKKRIEARELALQRKKTERTIQIVGVAVLVLIAIGIIWLIWPEPSSNVAELPTDVLQQYDAAPPMTIDVNKNYFATFTMAND
jgi:hypothetical protein